MQKYLVEVNYITPYCAEYFLEADSVEDAMKEAIKKWHDDDTLDGLDSNVDSPVISGAAVYYEDADGSGKYKLIANVKL